MACNERGNISLIRGCKVRKRDNDYDSTESESEEDANTLRPKRKKSKSLESYICPVLECDGCDPSQFEPIYGPDGTIIGKRFRRKESTKEWLFRKVPWLRHVYDYYTNVVQPTVLKTYNNPYGWGLVKCMIFLFIGLIFMFEFRRAVVRRTLEKRLKAFLG